MAPSLARCGWVGEVQGLAAWWWAVLGQVLVVQVLVARALTLLPLTLLANTWRPPRSKISLNQAACLWWAGSMRGAGEARCKGRGAEGGRLFGWQQSACLPVKLATASQTPSCNSH